MQIVDQTPYRTETGEIDIMGRIQGTLKFGLSWFDRIIIGVDNRVEVGHFNRITKIPNPVGDMPGH